MEEHKRRTDEFHRLHAEGCFVMSNPWDGFAVDPAGVAANVAMAADTGIAGLSIEDASGNPADPLFDFDLAVECVAAARRAISGTFSRFVDLPHVDALLDG